MSASACSRKTARASWGLTGPTGARGRPRGPIAPSTSALSGCYGFSAAFGRGWRPDVYLAHAVFEVVDFELEAVGGEGVGLYDVSTGPQVFFVDLGDHLGVGEVSPGVGVAETDAAFSQQRAHGAVPDQDPPGEQFYPLVRVLKPKPLSVFRHTSRGGERLRLPINLIFRNLLRGSWHLPREIALSPVAAASKGPSLHRSR